MNAVYIVVDGDDVFLYFLHVVDVVFALSLWPRVFWVLTLHVFAWLGPGYCGSYESCREWGLVEADWGRCEG